MKKIYRSKLDGKNKLHIQKLQQEWDEEVNSKAKGTGYENELVKKLLEAGFKDVKRAWGSDGRSLGWHEEVDITVTTGDSMENDFYKFQVKGRKSIADYLKPCEHVYGQILKADRHEPMVTKR